MIGLVDGAIYNIHEKELSQQILLDFAVKEHENDVLCVIRETGHNIYINVQDVKKQRFDEQCQVKLHEHVFRDLYQNPHMDGVVPLLDAQEDPVALAKQYISAYDHVYDGDTKLINTEIFELYECVCLFDVNEYSVLMYQQCFSRYKGKIILVGVEWNSILPYLGEKPKYAEVVVAENDEETQMQIGDRKVMGIYRFASNVAGYVQRCENGVFSYDEIMTLLYYFTVHRSAGNANPDKKMFRIDVRCGSLGLVAMGSLFDVPCAYLISKGYTPIINIVSSDDSIYSDGPGDDIWSKFFKQPTELDIYMLNNAADITVSPKACVTYSGVWLMQQISNCGSLDLLQPKYFSDQLLQYIEQYRQKILQKPEKTLGVLIRGTDYVAARPRGHAVQASPEQVIEKVKDAQKEGWGFEKIFVATEDEEALEKMRDAFGDKVSCVDQKRFRVQKGEYLYQQKEKENWKQGDGYRSGADYLCAMVLLSECGFFIASGKCSGTGLAVKLANGNWDQSYIFELGVYE